MVSSIQPAARIGGGNVEKIQLAVNHRPSSVEYEDKIFTRTGDQLDDDYKWWRRGERYIQMSIVKGIR